MPLKQGVGKKMTQCFQSACSMSGMCTPPHPMANIHLAYILMANTHLANTRLLKTYSAYDPFF